MTGEIQSPRSGGITKGGRTKASLDRERAKPHAAKTTHKAAREFFPASWTCPPTVRPARDESQPFGRETKWLACIRRTRTEYTAELKVFNGNDLRTFHTLMRFEFEVTLQWTFVYSVETNATCYVLDGKHRHGISRQGDDPLYFIHYLDDGGMRSNACHRTKGIMHPAAHHTWRARERYANAGILSQA